MPSSVSKSCRFSRAISAIKSEFSLPVGSIFFQSYNKKLPRSQFSVGMLSVLINGSHNVAMSLKMFCKFFSIFYRIFWVVLFVSSDNKPGCFFRFFGSLSRNEKFQVYRMRKLLIHKVANYMISNSFKLE